MSNQSKYFRIGRTIFRRAASRDITLLTCENEWKAALKLRAFIRTNGGAFSPIH